MRRRFLSDSFIPIGIIRVIWRNFSKNIKKGLRLSGNYDIKKYRRYNKSATSLLSVDNYAQRMYLLRPGIGKNQGSTLTGAKSRVIPICALAGIGPVAPST